MTKNSKITRISFYLLPEQKTEVHIVRNMHKCRVYFPKSLPCWERLNTLLNSDNAVMKVYTYEDMIIVHYTPLYTSLSSYQQER